MGSDSLNTTKCALVERPPVCDWRLPITHHLTILFMPACCCLPPRLHASEDLGTDDSVAKSPSAKKPFGNWHSSSIPSYPRPSNSRKADTPCPFPPFLPNPPNEPGHRTAWKDTLSRPELLFCSTRCQCYSKPPHVYPSPAECDGNELGPVCVAVLGSHHDVHCG